MYLVGIVPVLLLPFFRRRVQETARFDRQQREREESGLVEGWLPGWWRPLRELALRYPGRALAVASIGALGSAGHTVAFSFFLEGL